MNIFFIITFNYSSGRDGLDGSEKAVLSAGLRGKEYQNDLVESP